MCDTWVTAIVEIVTNRCVAAETVKRHCSFDAASNAAESRRSVAAIAEPNVGLLTFRESDRSLHAAEVTGDNVKNASATSEDDLPPV